MRFHWQNLNEKPGGRTGLRLRHGRAWWALTDRAGVNWEWVLGGLRCALHLGFAKSEEVGLHCSIALPLLGSLYLTVYGGLFAWLARKLLPNKWSFESGEDREISVRVFSWALWWEIWRDPMAGWSRKVPRWRSGSFHLLDWLFGRTKHAERELSVTPVVIPMPERGYKGRVRLFESTWRRQRWPLAWQRMVRAEVKMDDGEQIPHPGKGENSYDCGEDATFSLTCQATTIEAAIASMVEAVMRSRRRHGGSTMWAPAEKKASVR